MKAILGALVAAAVLGASGPALAGASGPACDRVCLEGYVAAPTPTSPRTARIACRWPGM